MKCEICNKGPMDGVSLHRVNELGVKGVWRCLSCMTHEQEADIPNDVRAILGIIELENQKEDAE